MVTIIASNDNFLGEKLAQLARAGGSRPLRSASIERITLELKKRESFVIIDMAWEDIQVPGLLRKLVNVGRITGSQVMCISPNTDEKLKKLARSSGCDQCFIRYDLETGVRESLMALGSKKPAA